MLSQTSDCPASGHSGLTDSVPAAATLTQSAKPSHGGDMPKKRVIDESGQAPQTLTGHPPLTGHPDSQGFPVPGQECLVLPVAFFLRSLQRPPGACPQDSCPRGTQGDIPSFIAVLSPSSLWQDIHYNRSCVNTVFQTSL